MTRRTPPPPPHSCMMKLNTKDNDREEPQTQRILPSIQSCTIKFSNCKQPDPRVDEISTGVLFGETTSKSEATCQWIYSTGKYSRDQWSVSSSRQLLCATSLISPWRYHSTMHTGLSFCKIDQASTPSPQHDLKSSPKGKLAGIGMSGSSSLFMPRNQISWRSWWD